MSISNKKAYVIIRCHSERSTSEGKNPKRFFPIAQNDIGTLFRKHTIIYGMPFIFSQEIIAIYGKRQ